MTSEVEKKFSQTVIYSMSIFGKSVRLSFYCTLSVFLKVILKTHSLPVQAWNEKSLRKNTKDTFSTQCQTFLEICEESFLNCPIVTCTSYIRDSAAAGSKPSMERHDGKTQQVLEKSQTRPVSVPVSYKCDPLIADPKPR